MRQFIVFAFALSLTTMAAGSAAAAPNDPPAGDKGDKGDKAAHKARILGAIELPGKTQALRKSGADEKEVKAALKAAKAKKLAPGEAAELIGEASAAIKEHGPVDNFGAFVQSKLDEGLRGKDLAAAIRQEHATRGKGKGHEGKGPDEAKGHEGKGPDEAKGEGKAPDEAKGEGKGPDEAKAEGKGAPEGKGPDAAEGKAPADAKGQPDGKGKPEDKAKPEGKK